MSHDGCHHLRVFPAEQFTCMHSGSRRKVWRFLGVGAERTAEGQEEEGNAEPRDRNTGPPTWTLDRSTQHPYHYLHGAVRENHLRHEEIRRESTGQDVYLMLKSGRWWFCKNRQKGLFLVYLGSNSIANHFWFLKYWVFQYTCVIMKITCVLTKNFC